MIRYEDQLRKYADVLTHYSMAEQFPDGLRGKTVHLSGERNPEKGKLVSLVVREVQAAGGMILDRMHDPEERVRLFYQAAQSNDPSSVIAAAQTEAGFLDQPNTVYLNLRGVQSSERYGSYQGVSIKDMHNLFWQTLSPHGQRMMRSRPWTVALYPMDAEARANGFVDVKERPNVHGYRKAVLRPCIDVDYREMRRQYAEFKALLDEADYVEIVTHQLAGTTKAQLTIGIQHRTAVFDDGHKNMPGGEIFVTPVTNAVEGSIFTSVSFFYRGSLINGVMFKFDNGNNGHITKYSAVKDQGNNLDRIVKVYDAQGKPTNETHGIGEWSLGLHPAIDPRMKVSSYVEKRGGVLTLGVGFGYEDSVSELINEPDLTKSDALLKTLQDQGVFPRANSHTDIPVFDFSNHGNGCEVYVGGRGYRQQIIWNKDSKIWEVVKST